MYAITVAQLTTLSLTILSHKDFFGRPSGSYNSIIRGQPVTSPRHAFCTNNIFLCPWS